MQSYYPEFKQMMREAGFPVTEGDAFAIEDLQWVLPFVASEAYQSGQPFELSKAFAGFAYPSVLPISLASQLSHGSFSNGTLWNNATLDGKGKWMLNGSGNPVNKWAISNTASIQVGISPRYRHSPAPVSSDANGVYTMSRSDADGNAWAFAFSVACRGENVKLSDYTIGLSIGLNSDGQQAPNLMLEYDAAANAWNSPEGDSITDSFQSDDGTVVQDIQSYVFDYIKGKLMPESMRDEEVPYGRYIISLTAVNADNGDTAAVIVPIHVL